MVTDKQVVACKEQLLTQKKEILEHLEDHFGLDLAQVHESVGELSNYDNHPGDTATELFEREKDIALNEHIERGLKDIEKALSAIDQGTYGICEVCQKDISFDRLEAIPTTLRCLDHAEHFVASNRPVEEEVLDPDLTRTGEDESTIFDAEDSWQQVSKYGSSETPSDFYNTDKTYQDMFFDSDELVSSVEEIEGFLLSDINGNYIGVNEKHEAYEDYLEENDVDSIMYD
ncbi:MULTISPECIES: TraR/DksA C4-type zinc finger protein [Paraliobacillus]|uniref:TraR/DksA C4-type zinc finger protein n=1 Tax=Paraliobacillus TaxID=200903 RepID=UPI000DD3759F|nr:MULTISPECIES: TraR/DksA C4-type zinc finger protein [Paraliobacillus]